jgi:hypothetical protein
MFFQHRSSLPSMGFSSGWQMSSKRNFTPRLSHTSYNLHLWSTKSGCSLDARVCDNRGVKFRTQCKCLSDKVCTLASSEHTSYNPIFKSVHLMPGCILCH